MRKSLPLLHDSLYSPSPSLFHDITYRHMPACATDVIARNMVKFLSGCMNILFGNNYGHRAVILETIAGVPGAVAGVLMHLKSLRLIKYDDGLVSRFLHEAENERMHLIIYGELVKLNVIDKVFIFVLQFLFVCLYGFMYLVSSKLCHRVIGYFEEEAVHSYLRFKELVTSGAIVNCEATLLAKSYWNLNDNAKLLDMIDATIVDECIHRDVNHSLVARSDMTNFWSLK